MVRVMEIARDTLSLKIKYKFIFGRLMSTLYSVVFKRWFESSGALFLLYADSYLRLNHYYFELVLFNSY